jgi:hypothetical protein
LVENTIDIECDKWWWSILDRKSNVLHHISVTIPCEIGFTFHQPPRDRLCEVSKSSMTQHGHLMALGDHNHEGAGMICHFEKWHPHQNIRRPRHSDRDMGLFSPSTRERHQPMDPTGYHSKGLERPWNSLRRCQDHLPHVHFYTSDKETVRSAKFHE